MRIIQSMALAVVLAGAVGGYQIDAGSKGKARPKQPVELEREFNLILPDIARGDFIDLTEAQNLINQLRAKKDNTRANKLQKLLDEARSVGNRANANLEYHMETQATLAQTQREVKQLEAKLQESSTELQDAIAHLLEANTRGDDLSQAIKELQKARTDMNNSSSARIGQLETALGSAQNMADAYKKGSETWMGRADECKATIKKLQGELAVASKKETEFVQYNNECDANLTKCQEDLKQAQGAAKADIEKIPKIKNAVRTYVNHEIDLTLALIDTEATLFVRRSQLSSQYEHGNAVGENAKEFEDYISVITKAISGLKTNPENINVVTNNIKQLFAGKIESELVRNRLSPFMLKIYDRMDPLRNLVINTLLVP